MSRQTVLANIRAALGTSESTSAIHIRERNVGHYSEQNSTEMLTLFERRLEEYGARVFNCSEEAIGAKIAEILLTSQQTKYCCASGIESGMAG